MKNKKGFTLIELLAVIVVLAIIALIATPIVMNTIKNAKKGAAERSAENYVRAVEIAISTRKLNNEPVPDGTYTIDSDGNLGGINYIDKDLCNAQPSQQNCEIGTEQKIVVESGGSRPSSGKITIKEGMIVDNEVLLSINDYQLTVKEGNGTATEVGDKLCVSVFGESLTAGSEYTCELGDGEKTNFYILEMNGDTISLIMETNYGTEQYPFCNQSGANKSDATQCLADGLNPGLEKIKTTWTKLIENGGTVSLPSYNQLKKYAVENDYLPKWLVGDVSYYWTSTSYTTSDGAYLVRDYSKTDNNKYGMISADGIGNSNNLRPVITVLKSNLS